MPVSSTESAASRLPAQESTIARSSHIAEQRSRHVERGHLEEPRRGTVRVEQAFDRAAQFCIVGAGAIQWLWPQLGWLVERNVKEAIDFPESVARCPTHASSHAANLRPPSPKAQYGLGVAGSKTQSLGGARSVPFGRTSRQVGPAGDRR